MEALARPGVGTRGRIALALLAFGWFFLVVYRTAFHEGFVFLAGLLAVAFLGVLFSRIRPRWLRATLLILLALANLLAGIALASAADRLRETRTAFAAALLERAGEALVRYRLAAGTLPECPWNCMTGELEKLRFWGGIVVYDDHGRVVTEYLPHLPARDPWGCRYVYVIVENRTFELSSSGPDRRFGTPDDILRTFGEETYRRLDPNLRKYTTEAAPPAPDAP